jgi:hypothetical protein
VPDQRYILTARHEGQWRWRAVSAPSLKKAIVEATEVAREMHDEHEVWKIGIVTLTDTNKRVVWWSPIADLHPKGTKQRG